VVRAKVYRGGVRLFGALDFRSSKGEINFYITSGGLLKGELKVSLRIDHL
jgi:hypothetical protein